MMGNACQEFILDMILSTTKLHSGAMDIDVGNKNGGKKNHVSVRNNNLIKISFVLPSGCRFSSTLSKASSGENCPSFQQNSSFPLPLQFALINFSI